VQPSHCGRLILRSAAGWSSEVARCKADSSRSTAFRDHLEGVRAGVLQSVLGSADDADVVNDDLNHSSHVCKTV
jgi:hypothetical protein